MGFFSHRVKRSDLEGGDHIYTWRTPIFAYSHHGIFVGGNKVVHFTQYQNLSSCDSSSFNSVSSSFQESEKQEIRAITLALVVPVTCLDFHACRSWERKSGVVMSCLNCFLGNGSLYRYEYGVSGVTLVTKLRSGICTTKKSDPPEAVIHRAMYLLQHGFGKYCVISNNCEDFALYCKTGLVVVVVDRPREKGSDSSGGCSGQVLSVASIPSSFILSLPVKLFGSNPYVFGATTAGVYGLSRYCTDIGVRDDVIKVDVEDIAAFHGNVRVEEDEG